MHLPTMNSTITTLSTLLASKSSLQTFDTTDAKPKPCSSYYKPSVCMPDLRPRATHVLDPNADQVCPLLWQDCLLLSLKGIALWTWPPISLVEGFHYRDTNSSGVCRSHLPCSELLEHTKSCEDCLVYFISRLLMQLDLVIPALFSQLAACHTGGPPYAVESI
jgi:hypothetical protein